MDAVEARRLLLPIDVNQRMSEEEQLQRLDANHTKWQWAMSRSPKLQRGVLEFTDIHFIDTDGYTVTLEVAYSHVFPYPVDVVTKRMWSIFLEETGMDDEDEAQSYVQGYRSSDDAIISVFSWESTMGGAVKSGGKIHGKWVAKKQKSHSESDKNRHLVTLNWHYELSEFGNELDGVGVEEDWWLRLVDAREIGHSHLTEPLTAMQQVRRVRLKLSSGRPVELDHVQRVTSMAKQHIQGDLDWTTRLIENALLSPPQQEHLGSVEN